MMDWLVLCCEPMVDLCGVWMLLIVLGTLIFVYFRDRREEKKRKGKKNQAD